MAEKLPLAEALRTEIVKLATEGDEKTGGALTADVLLRIMRIAKTGRELLVSLDASPSNLANMVRRPKPAYFPLAGGAEDDDLGDISPVAPYATAPANENFGMTALRELIAVAKNQLNGGTSPAKLVEALAIAREKGLDDVARELERQLEMGKPAALPAPRPLETLVSAGDGVTKTTIQEGKP